MTDDYPIRMIVDMFVHLFLMLLTFFSDVFNFIVFEKLHRPKKDKNSFLHRLL